MTGPDGVTLRRARPDDGDAIGDVWLSAWRATFDFPPGHPDEDVRRWLRDELVPKHETWVAEAPGGRVVALMAVSDDMVEQLYVAPDHHREGIGSRLLALAKERRPAGLDLYCFQANTRAQRFYEDSRVRGGRVRGRQRERGAATGHPVRVAAGVAGVTDVAAARAWTVRSTDGTAIAVTTVGSGPPLVLVHGAAADHTTFRVVVPLLAPRFTTHAIDRRGRGGSGDTRALRPRARVRGRGGRRRGGASR